MCTSPIFINVSGRTKNYKKCNSISGDVCVPCGHCEECLNSLRNDHLIRIDSEYNDIIANGGKVLFLTFTYDDYNVPLLKYRIVENNLIFDSIDIDSDIRVSYINSSNRIGYMLDNNIVYSFNKKHIQLYWNYIRKYFERKCNITSDAIKYYIVSEYGSDSRYTQRPHYHCLIFLTKQAIESLYDKNYKTDNQILKFFKSFWIYGNVSASKYGLYVKDNSCVAYCCKYLNKPEQLIKLRIFRKLFDYIYKHRSDIKNYCFKDKSCVDKFNINHNYKIFGGICKENCIKTFCLKSMYLGFNNSNPLVYAYKHGYKNICVSELEKGYKFVINNEVRFVPYSRYYYKKVLFDFHHNVYQLNDYGFTYYNQKFIDNFINKYDYIVNFRRLYPDYRKILSSLNFSKFNIDIFDKSLDDSLMIQNYIIYSGIIRGRIFEKEIFKSVNKLLYDKKFDVLDKAKVMFIYSYGHIYQDRDLELSNVENEVPFDLYYRKKVEFSDVFYDSVLENIYLCIINVENYTKRQQNEIKHREQEHIKLLNDIKNRSRYFIS